MKNIRKSGLLFIFVLGVTTVLTGCREDEKLNLSGYPDSQVGITISDVEEAAPMLTLKAVYDGDGKLGVSGAISRQYVFYVDTPSLEDISLQVEPLVVNIPDGKVSLDKQKLTIPAGRRDAEPVAVTLADDDFSFAEPDLEARTYEIGVRVLNIDGSQVSLAGGNEGKVIVEKEAYVATASFAGQNVTFKRSYAFGEILNPDPMTYSFEIVLDRPAHADVKVTIASTGIPAEFANDQTLTPATMTIPAGQKSTGPITWSMTDDFLKQTDQPETYKVTLSAHLETEDQTVVLSETKKSVEITIIKAFNVIEFLTAPESSWVRYTPTGWVVYGSAGGQEYAPMQGLLTDTGDLYYLNPPMAVWIDMAEAREIHGLILKSYSNSANYMAKRCAVYTSDDGVTWTQMGEMDTEFVGTHYIKFLAPITTRWVKYEGLEKNGWGIDLIGFGVYGKE